MKLMFRSKPLPNEGLNGYLLRLAEGNGYDGIGFLCGSQDVSRPQLMQWLGLREARPLSGLVPQLTSPRNAYIKPWNHKTSRYCPECLKEELVWHREWECTYITVCPVHGYRLIDRCGVCGEQLTWKRKNLMSCDCGALLKAKPVAATSSEIALAQVLYDKLQNGCGSLKSVMALGFADLCHLVHVLGVYSSQEEGRTTQKVTNLTSLGVAQQLIGAAAEILSDWPLAFHRMLDDLIALRAQQADKPSLAKQYGYFYSYVFTRMKERRFEFIRQAFESHIVRNWTQPLNQRNRRISAQARSSGSWVPLDLAVSQLGTTHSQLKLLFHAGHIIATVRTLESGRRSIFLDREELPAIKELLGDMVNQRTACSILNIKKKRMLQLARDRAVNVYLEPLEGGGKWGISRKSMQEILSVQEGLPLSEVRLSENFIRMDRVLQFWLQEDFLFPKLIRAVKEQEIKPVSVCPELVGIQGWVFDEERLKQWRTKQIQAARDGAMTIPQLAEILKVKQEAVYHFVKIGLIQTLEANSSREMHLITAEETRRFNENYALSRELAELMDTSASQASRMLNRRGIKAVCGKDIDGCVQYVYRRDSFPIYVNSEGNQQL